MRFDIPPAAAVIFTVFLRGRIISCCCCQRLVCTGFYGKETIHRILSSFTRLILIILTLITGWHVGYKHPGKVCCPEFRINFAFTQEFLQMSCGIFHHKYLTIRYLISMERGTPECLDTSQTASSSLIIFLMNPYIQSRYNHYKDPSLKGVREPSRQPEGHVRPA
jgi:hypothetical protein